ncbi:hypothetical protein OJ997_20915 [Solirubrobacter phytolaccae]|uniref:Uncharacterized protein n=1 Tax=Solirubrobacter phytolaccae TaxID=1404360 RepID=A0A9X3NEV5_9ACTN|nr:hypothetical protein [Solirubrobacter phytolaccae]MDA0182786.1 hypothetical protein [Solirubrobacter phytolaccae]
MNDDLFAEGGPEGRNADADDFERRLRPMADDLGYTVVDVNFDTLVGDTARSQGMDALWAFHNPVHGRAQGWLTEAKRHSGPSRYTPQAIASEVQTLRDKLRRLGNQRQRFFGDAEIAQHIEELSGGILIHRTPRYDPDKAARIFSGIETQRNESGPAPVRVAYWGPDSLNGLGEAFSRFGTPSQFWWPATRRNDGVWARPCPPEQVAAGLVLYRSEEGRVVLVVRDALSRHEPAAIRELARRTGESFDVVAYTHGTTEERRLASEGWARAHEQTSQLARGRLPERVDVLSVGHETLGPFERRWDESDGSTLSASPGPARHRRRPGRLETSPVLPSRRRVVTPYPSPTSVADTFADKASLHGTKRFFARHGLIVFADDKLGTSRAAEEVWLRPSAYRAMGHMLDMTPLPTVAGFAVAKLTDEQRQIEGVLPSDLIREFAQAAAEVKGMPYDAERSIRLRDLQISDATWQLSAELVYDHVFDLVGGERVRDEAQVEIYARAVRADEIDIAVVTTREDDFRAARAWIQQALVPMQRGWMITPVSLPSAEPQRSASLQIVVDSSAGDARRVIGVSSPHQHRDASRERPGTGFPRIVRESRYDTEFSDIATIRERCLEDGVAIGEVTSYFRPLGSPSAVVAIRLRQRARDAHLSMRWQSGKALAQIPATAVDRDTWESLHGLEWMYSKKRELLLASWARAAEALRSGASPAVLSA